MQRGRKILMYHHIVRKMWHWIAEGPRPSSTINVGSEASEEEIRLFKKDGVLMDEQLKPDVIKIDVQRVEIKVMMDLKKN